MKNMNKEISIIEKEYKTIGETSLKIKIYKPVVEQKNEKHSAIIFFFGGGWTGGSIEQFKNQCIYFASHGMVSITPEYRIKNKHETTPFESVEDGKDAINWVISHSEELAINTEQIVLAGGSAGGHVALCSALINNIGSSIKKMPFAFVLFNPVVDTTESGYGYKRLKDRAQEISPIHHLRTGLAPMILFYGTEDITVPYDRGKLFAEEMKKYNNKCEFISFQGQKHGFFNKWEDEDNPYYNETLKKSEEFLRSLGCSICD